MKPDNAFREVCTDLNQFFRKWFIMLRPFHNLTNREIEVIAAFAKERYDLSKVILDPAFLDRIVMSEETKKKVREVCNVSPEYFQVMMSKFKKNKVIVDNKINPKFLPNNDVGEDKGNKFLIYFDLNEVQSDS